jgi:hypothetical protein
MMAAQFQTGFSGPSDQELPLTADSRSGESLSLRALTIVKLIVSDAFLCRRRFDPNPYISFILP